MGYNPHTDGFAETAMLACHNSETPTLACKRLSFEVVSDVEKVSALMALAIGVIFLIATCTRYNESANQGYRSQNGFYGAETEYERTGQPSVLPGWAPRHY